MTLAAPDDVFNWAESLMDAAEETRGGYRPFVSLEARERERGVAERIIVNERLRQGVDEWLAAPQTSDPRVSQEAKMDALRDVALDALEAQP